MDIDFTLPSPMMTLLLGLAAFAVGLAIVKRPRSFWIHLLGLLLLLGGASFMLSVTPDNVIPPAFGFMLLTLVFIYGSYRMARSGDKTGGVTGLIGWILTILGIIALFVQIGDYVFLPTSSVWDLLVAGWNSALHILGVAGTRLE